MRSLKDATFPNPVMDDILTTGFPEVVKSWVPSFGAAEDEEYLEFAVLVILTFDEFDRFYKKPEQMGRVFFCQGREFRVDDIDDSLDELLHGWKHYKVDADEYGCGGDTFKGALRPDKEWLRDRHIDNWDTKRARAVYLRDVKETGCALAFIPEGLQCDEEIVLAALTEDGAAIEYVHEDLLNNVEFMKRAYSCCPEIQLSETNLEDSVFAREIKAGAKKFGVSDRVYALSRPQRVIQVQALSKVNDFDCSLTWSDLGGNLDTIVFPVRDDSWHNTSGLRQFLARQLDTVIDDFVIIVTPPVLEARRLKYYPESRVLTTGTRDKEAMLIDPVDAELWGDLS